MSRRYLAAILATLFGGCNGTETQNPATPLVSFQGSDCKRGPPGGGADAGFKVGQAAQALTLGSAYDGLQCIAWSLVGANTTRFDLVNFDEGCGVTWQGRAAVEADGTVELDAVNPRCEVALCGWCIYDWSFDVRGVHEGADVSLHIAITDSSGKACASATGPYATTLPTTGATEGIVCRPAFKYAVEWQAGERGTTGQLHMPCLTGGACNAGLTCGPLGSATDDPRCLEPCTSDADCPLPGVLGCQENACRLVRTW